MGDQSTVESMDEVAERLMRTSRTIAVVGLSTDPAKSAHTVPARLQQVGYRVIGVHPTATTLLGEPAYRSLEDIPEQVDFVDVFRPSPEAAGIAEQAVRIGARGVWLQLGIASPEARRIAEEGGLDYVEDRCTAVVLAVTGARPPAS
ncbi:succinyl-CoA ligase subunit alpha [Cnuibacter physcomitrellae]|nr:CoA-binding protein [Cnuibacter physcomitrellae]GGI39570.1 succinyl-CoA ligase subunit alpha [Cnuibacter physcomitrellae]